MQYIPLTLQLHEYNMSNLHDFLMTIWWFQSCPWNKKALTVHDPTLHQQHCLYCVIKICSFLYSLKKKKKTFCSLDEYLIVSNRNYERHFILHYATINPQSYNKGICIHVAHSGWVMIYFLKSKFHRFESVTTFWALTCSINHFSWHSNIRP